MAPRREDDRDERDAISEVEKAIVEIRTEIRWHKWLLFGLLAATASPKLGGPQAAQVVASLLEGVAQAAG